MDFIDRLQDKINETPRLPLQCMQGYLGAEESLVLYSLPGSNVVEEYMDGTTDQAINYEIALKHKSIRVINQVMWDIEKGLAGVKELPSEDGSYEFEEIEITNKPFINQTDDQGWFVFLLNVQAKITVYKNKEE